MAMTPRLSKAVLTSHITFSVGLARSSSSLLVLAITGLTHLVFTGLYSLMMMNLMNVVQ